MSRVALSTLLAVAAVAVAQDPTGTEPLYSKHFAYPTAIVSNRFCTGYMWERMACTEAATTMERDGCSCGNNNSRFATFKARYTAPPARNRDLSSPDL